MTDRAHPPAAAALLKLSERQKKHLRALAHALKPVVRLGNAGMTAAVSLEASRALEDHELIKVKGPAGDRAARDALFAALARATGSILVHRIGNVAVLYRPRPGLPRILIPDS
jgi:RNA-binding protein